MVNLFTCYNAKTRKPSVNNGVNTIFVYFRRGEDTEIKDRPEDLLSLKMREDFPV